MQVLMCFVVEVNEVGAEGKMLLLACDNGHLRGHALQGGEEVWGTSTSTSYMEKNRGTLFLL